MALMVLFSKAYNELFRLSSKVGSWIWLIENNYSIFLLKIHVENIFSGGNPRVIDVIKW